MKTCAAYAKTRRKWRGQVLDKWIRALATQRYDAWLRGIMKPAELLLLVAIFHLPFLYFTRQTVADKSVPTLVKTTFMNMCRACYKQHLEIFGSAVIRKTRRV